MSELSDAQAKLDIAIREFLDVKIPGSYAEHWLLLIDLTVIGEDQSDMMTYEEYGMMTWVHRRGMLEIAAQHSREVQSDQFRRNYGQ